MDGPEPVVMAVSKQKMWVEQDGDRGIVMKGLTVSCCGIIGSSTLLVCMSMMDVWCVF